MCRCQNFKKEYHASLTLPSKLMPDLSSISSNPIPRGGLGDLAEQVAAVEDDFQIFVGDVGGLR